MVIFCSIPTQSETAPDAILKNTLFFSVTKGYHGITGFTTSQDL